MKMCKENYDVVVVGGGIAGCAAALRAARDGAKVALIEKTLLPGGLATAGLIYVYLPIDDGCGHQVSFGITRELLTAGHKYGPGAIPENWQTPSAKNMNERLYATFSPASLILALDELLEKSGVTVWLDTLFCKAVIENDTVTAIEVENKSGRITIPGKRFIDATGDADVARSAGAKVFSQTNVLSQWTILYDREAKASSRNLADSLTRHILYDKELAEKEPEKYSGIDGRLVSGFALAARKKVRDYVLENYRAGRKREEFFPLLVPGVVNLRHTFSICGRFLLNPENALDRFPDSVGLFGNWKRPGPVYELPYRALIPEPVKGLLTAGRCIAVAGETCEMTRVIPVAAMTGEICGAAAALSLQQRQPMDELAPDLLREKLKPAGFCFHLSDLG